ncbi:MAG: sigma-70 family RNA polymerase sigma factor [Pseudomonadota bacterium]
MLLYRSSNYKAFELLYKRFKGKIFAYFINKTGNKNTAEDLLQDFFQIIHKKRGIYNPKYRVEAWFFTIAHNLFVSNYRKEKLRKHSSNVERLLSPEENKVIDIEKIEEQILTLTDEQKNAINSRYYEDLSFADIGTRLNKKEQNIRKIISRAIIKIKEGLKNEIR